MFITLQFLTRSFKASLLSQTRFFFFFSFFSSLFLNLHGALNGYSEQVGSRREKRENKKEEKKRWHVHDTGIERQNGHRKKNLDDLFLRFFFFFAGSSPSSLVKTEGSSADTGSPKKNKFFFWLFPHFGKQFGYWTVTFCATERWDGRLNDRAGAWPMTMALLTYFRR